MTWVAQWALRAQLCMLSSMVSALILVRLHTISDLFCKTLLRVASLHSLLVVLRSLV